MVVYHRRFLCGWGLLLFGLSLGSLYGCGHLALCQEYDWGFVVTFKEGRTPELWREFQALLKLRPQQN